MKELRITSLDELLPIHSADPQESMVSSWSQLPPIRVFEIPKDHLLREFFHAKYLINDGMKRYASAKKFNLPLQAILIEPGDEKYSFDFDSTLGLARNYYGDYIGW